jgi:hypothetical protein
MPHQAGEHSTLVSVTTSCRAKLGCHGHGLHARHLSDGLAVTQQRGSVRLHGRLRIRLGKAKQTSGLLHADARVLPHHDVKREQWRTCRRCRAGASTRAAGRRSAPPAATAVPPPCAAPPRSETSPTAPEYGPPEPPPPAVSQAMSAAEQIDRRSDSPKCRPTCLYYSTLRHPSSGAGTEDS